MTVQDLIEEWIEMRSKLQKQTKALEANEILGFPKGPNASTQTTVSHLRNCIGEFNKLLKEHAQVDRI